MSNLPPKVIPLLLFHYFCWTIDPILSLRMFSSEIAIECLFALFCSTTLFLSFMRMPTIGFIDESWRDTMSPPADYLSAEPMRHFSHSYPYGDSCVQSCSCGPRFFNGLIFFSFTIYLSGFIVFFYSSHSRCQALGIGSRNPGARQSPYQGLTNRMIYNF